ncbi:MAG: PD40 domain-containing protein [Bacteroidetes bacterium]|nr:PD40 domain-containing protein [Bacteroidota bacterium]
MRIVITFLFCLFMLNGFCQNKSYDYCYSGNKGIYVYSIADQKAYPILRGVSATDLCISPDGMKVAYTVNSKDGRNIGVIDLNSKQKTVLHTQSNNCYGPVWSPDGNYIAYNVFNDQTSKWSIAVIGTAPGSAPQVLTGKLSECYMPAWTTDSKNVVVQDMSAVYVFDLYGNITTTISIPEIPKTFGASSSDRFIFTSDGRKIVFTLESDEPGFENGPPSAVFVYDVASKAATRLLPKGYYANNIWLKGDVVLISGGNIKAKSENIYAVGLDGKNLKILFHNANGISAKN